MATKYKAYMIYVMEFAVRDHFRLIERIKDCRTAAYDPIVIDQIIIIVTEDILSGNLG